jgi:hypothetical protein
MHSDAGDVGSAQGGTGDHDVGDRDAGDHDAGNHDAGDQHASDAGITTGDSGSYPDAGFSNPCGGCQSLEICIYQIGGPGPSHYACAVQNPCGAAGLCACIVNQGTCQPGSDPQTGFYGCLCDNGLK